MSAETVEIYIILSQDLSFDIIITAAKYIDTLKLFLESKFNSFSNVGTPFLCNKYL